MVLGFAGAKKDAKKEPEDATLNKYSLVMSYQELEKATDNFSPSKRMGQGGFGAVYRGMQPDGTEIAVKALENARDAGFEEEVRVLSMFRHPHLVVLMGFARNGPKRFLVYELMEGGDLFNRIHDTKQDFPWRDRICIAFDAACGLSHLHRQVPKVFHRDIKSANILLTRSGLAKVADFGLARICKVGGAQRLKDFGGTPGYICPIHEKTQVITERSEVFSFGVVLLELLTGYASCWGKRSDAVSWLWKEMSSFSKLEAAADKRAKWTKRALSEVGQLALNCTDSKDEEQRPEFNELVRLLRGMRDLPEKDVAQVAAPLSPIKAAKPGQQQVVFERPLLWYMKVVWVEERQAALPSTIIEWRATERGSPIRVRNMTFGRTDYEGLLQPILSEQLLKCISRKAFEIEVETSAAAVGKGLGQSAWGERIGCLFTVRNLGKNGMGVGTLSSCAIIRSNEALPLRDGDHISLCYCEDPGSENPSWVPFLIFQFRLTDPEEPSSCAVLKDTRLNKAPGYDARAGGPAGYLKLPIAA